MQKEKNHMLKQKLLLLEEEEEKEEEDGDEEDKVRQNQLFTGKWSIRVWDDKTSDFK